MLHIIVPLWYIVRVLPILVYSQLVTILHTFSLISPILEWLGEMWCATKVVRERELGGPVERLEKQMEKLSLHSPDMSADEKVTMFVWLMAADNERVRCLDVTEKPKVVLYYLVILSQI